MSHQGTTQCAGRPGSAVIATAIRTTGTITAGPAHRAVQLWRRGGGWPTAAVEGRDPAGRAAGRASRSSSRAPPVPGLEVRAGFCGGAIAVGVGHPEPGCVAVHFAPRLPGTPRPAAPDRQRTP